LQPNTIYSYRVTAFKSNAGGRSNGQNPPEGRILLPPTAPTALTVTAHTTTTIDLQWQDNNPVGPSNFKIERAPYNNSAFVEIGQTTVPSAGGLVTFQDAGLTANTGYKYRVYAFNTPPLGVVGGGNSTKTPAIIQWTLPEAATNLTTSPETGPPPRVWVHLSWTDNNGATPAKTRIERRRLTAPADMTFTAVATVGAGTTTFLDKNTLGNFNYEYQVIATNDGPSGDAAPSNLARQLTLPEKPTNFKVVVPTDGTPRRGRTQIDLSWTDNSGDPSAFEVWKSTDGVNFAFYKAVAAGVTTVTVTGLVENTDYWFKVRGTNSTGDGDWAGPVKTHTLKKPPVTPTALTATVRSDIEIFLKWEDNSIDEDGFRIERSTNGGAFATAATVSKNVTSYLDSGLAPSTTYVYRMVAFNNGGDSGLSRTAGGKTAPGAPSNLVLSNVKATSLTVQFKDNRSDEDGFKLERRVGAGNYAVIATLPARANSGGTVSYNDTGLTSGVTYSYRVRAYRSVTFSRYSAVATQTTP